MEVPPPPPPANVGDILNGRYRILGKISEGTYGIVYKAEDVVNGRRIAVKIQRINDETTRETFENEKSAYLALSTYKNCYQYIVCLYDIFSFGDFGCLVLELMVGDAYNFRPRDQESRLNLISDCLTALTYIHEKGFAHQDIKPTNILVRGTMYKLGDLGLTCSTPLLPSPSKSIRSCTSHASPGFDAPEFFEYPDPWAQVSTEEAQKADVWALGVSFYVLFKGEYPFKKTEEKIQLTQEDVEHFEGHISFGSVSAKSINKLINSMLTVDPDDRPPARYLLDLLNAAGGTKLKELPVVPKTPSPRPRAEEMCTGVNGNTFNREALIGVLTSLNVKFNPNASTADLCMALKGNIPCNLKGVQITDEQLSNLAKAFEVTGSRRYICAKINQKLSEQGLINARRTSQIIAALLLESSQAVLAGDASTSSSTEQSIRQLLDLTAPVKGVDAGYLLSYYYNTVQYLQNTYVAPETEYAIKLAEVVVNKFQRMFTLPSWMQLNADSLSNTEKTQPTGPLLQPISVEMIEDPFIVPQTSPSLSVRSPMTLTERSPARMIPNLSKRQ
jgi:serine/threonine protein kinase